jgi:hypothetical protein
MTGQRLTLMDKIERARAAAEVHGRGYAVTFTGPAAEAHGRGSVDGYHGRPNAADSYATLDERESYQYGYETYYRAPKDRRGCRYEEALF